MVKRTTAVWAAMVWLLCWGFMMLASAAQPDAGRHSAADQKTGILLVAFGTSVPEAESAFAAIDQKVKAAFPGVPVRWAYTSSVIRKKLARTGRHLDAPAVALARMMDEGFARVAVQSLHIIPGAEFHDLRVNAEAFQEMATPFRRLAVGPPALSTAEDLTRAVDAVLEILPEARTPDQAVVLMGHGTRHPANVYYEAMMYRLQKMDRNIYMGTVEGAPSLEDIQAMLLKSGVRKAYLMPFMAVAGDHARNDMAGDDADSWKSVLTEAGIECVPVMKGLAEYDVFAEIWVDHLRAVMETLQ